MKRRKNTIIWGIPLVLSYITKDITFLGWEAANIISILLIVGLLWLIYNYWS